MPATMEDVLGAITTLANTVKEKSAQGENPKATLQWDDLKAQFETEIKAMVDLQVQEKLASQPVRPGAAGAPILSEGSKALLQNNRYAKMVQSFERDGVYKDGIQALRPVDFMIAAKILEGQVKKYDPMIGGGVPKPPSDDLRKALKAMDSTTAGSGDEYVPTNLAPQLWEDMFLASRVVSLFTRIPATSNPMDIGLGLGAITWRKVGENVGVSQSNPSTGKVTIGATQLAAQQAWSYTLDEDSAIALAPALRARIAQSGAEQMDAYVLNADDTATATGNINSDDGTPASDSYYLNSTSGGEGLRHQYLVDNISGVGTDESGTLEDATITTELKAMGKYAVDPNQLAFVCDPGTYLGGFLSAASGAPGANVITIDKFGTGAVVLTGQLAAYRGIPIVVSSSMPLTEADGKVSVTASNNTKGQIAIPNRMMWYVGFWRDLLIEADRDITKLQYILVESFRQGVVPWGTRSTNTHTGGIFDIG